MKESFAYCEQCNQIVEYLTEQKYVKGNAFGYNKDYLAKNAFCPVCQNQVFVKDYHDFNLHSKESIWKKLNGYLSVDQLQELLEKYDIGKRPFALAIGLGEQTFTNYLSGKIPSKSNEQLLLHVYHDPTFYMELIEQNKNLLTDIAYKKTIAAAQKQLNIKDQNFDSEISLYAAYLIMLCGDITHLQLQKLLYYAQALSIIYYGKYAFSDDCEAWVHGPVFKNIYDIYKDYKYENINSNQNIPSLKPEQKELLDTVAKTFGKYSGRILEEFTHKELPWKKAREGITDDEKSERIIHKDLIKEYFLEVKQKYNLVSFDDINTYINALLQGL